MVGTHRARFRPPLPGRVGGAVVAMVVVIIVVLTGCTGEDATPIGEVTTSTVDLGTPHLLPPNEQMEELAKQQCRDDPDLEQGEVNAVDPARPDEVISTVVVDCAEVRAGG
ncbi:MAG: hypothetical protein ACK5RL_07200 [Acidimicrobiales bacterium]